MGTKGMYTQGDLRHLSPQIRAKKMSGPKLPFCRVSKHCHPVPAKMAEFAREQKRHCTQWEKLQA